MFTEPSFGCWENKLQLFHSVSKRIYIYKSEFPFSSFNFRHFLGNRREKRISKFNIFKLSYQQTQFSFERNVSGTFIWLLKNELQLFGSVFERFFCFLISLGNHSFRCSISFSFSVTKHKREYGRYLSSRHLEDSEPLDLCNLLWNSPFSQWDYETRNENEMEFKISNNRNKWGSKFLFISQMTPFFCFLFSSIPLLPCWTLNFATWKNKFPHWKGLKKKIKIKRENHLIPLINKYMCHIFFIIFLKSINIPYHLSRFHFRLFYFFFSHTTIIHCHLL